MLPNYFNSFFFKTVLKNVFFYFLKWSIICFTIAILIGSTSAFFLISLNWVTQYREDHLWIITFLPLGGLTIGLLYHHFGKSVIKGNNLLIEEYYTQNKTIPLKMVPLIITGTLITHLLGGSAGREGTAVQIGGAIADQFTRYIGLNNFDRNTILIIGISAGFASVFGTPLTAAIFAIEVFILTKINYKDVFPSLFVAFISHYTVLLWKVEHTHFSVPVVPSISFSIFLWIVCVGVISGITAILFSKINHFWSNQFSKKIKYPPLRPLIGGSLLVLIIWFTGTTKFSGLGIPEIVNAFQYQSKNTDFLIKLLLTGLTLGSGFKGGEVTPLFFIGATLGSTLSSFIPLPIALLAAMGFVAVFSGATNTPLACSIMGLELFGITIGLYLTIACFTAYLCSGNLGIYHAQKMENSRKYRLFKKLKKSILQ